MVDVRFRQARSQLGMTLVELLITFAILAMLLALVSTSFLFYSRYWNDTFARFDQQQVYARSLLQVSDVVQSALPFVVKSENGQNLGYFLGRDEGFTLVSSRSLFANADDLVVIRLFREQSVRETGWMLVYEEASLTKNYLTLLNQELNFTDRLVLQRGLSSISFSYFSKPEVTDDLMSVEPAQWRPEHDAVQRKSLPVKIRIESDSGDLMFDLPGTLGKIFGRNEVGEN
ncbi:PulJ/GspJ family protein [Rheinheimera sp.]|uniref:PulJ/GspJ family protein n=1 Tax=Rheinheimera sp. TaxID=1869214 RepID=UPI003AF9F0B5